MPDLSSHEQEPNVAAERRLQIGAALLLGLVVLLGIVLRAGIRDIFPAGWWQQW